LTITAASRETVSPFALVSVSGILAYDERDRRQLHNSESCVLRRSLQRSDGKQALPVFIDGQKITTESVHRSLIVAAKIFGYAIRPTGGQKYRHPVSHSARPLLP
jgi:hypothetical protein